MNLNDRDCNALSLFLPAKAAQKARDEFIPCFLCGSSGRTLQNSELSIQQSRQVIIPARNSLFAYQELPIPAVPQHFYPMSFSDA
jgi:hypothetical protein